MKPWLSRQENKHIQNWHLEFTDLGDGTYRFTAYNQYSGEIKQKIVSLTQMFQRVMKSEIYNTNIEVKRTGQPENYGFLFEKPKRLAIFKRGK